MEEERYMPPLPLEQVAELPEIDDFAERLAAASLPFLIQFDRSGTDDNTITACKVNFAVLERMNMHALQKSLLDEVKKIKRDNKATPRRMEKVNELLGYYTTAIRDFDFMTEKKEQSRATPSRDPFIISTREYLTRKLLRESEIIPNSSPTQQVSLERASDRKYFRKGYDVLPGHSRGRHNKIVKTNNLYTRLALGIIGGLALIGPMLLMVLHKDLLTTLLTASVSTVLFAIGVAMFTELPGETVLGIVAAYAAVLVVFVGSSS